MLQSIFIRVALAGQGPVQILFYLFSRAGKQQLVFGKGPPVQLGVDTLLDSQGFGRDAVRKAGQGARLAHPVSLGLGRLGRFETAELVFVLGDEFVDGQLGHLSRGFLQCRLHGL